MASSRGELGPNRALLAHALQLEWLTLGWNLVEGGVALFAAWRAASVALLGFGLDSGVECLSACVLLWRLDAERRAADHAQVERLDRRAHRLVAMTLFALAAYVALDSVWTLAHAERPSPSALGIGVTAISIGVMMWLARAKRRAAVALGSRAMEADSFQTSACWWLSILTLAGIVLNASFGWWWADPVAALGMAPLLVREGLQAWRQEACCD